VNGIGSESSEKDREESASEEGASEEGGSEESASEEGLRESPLQEGSSEEDSQESRKEEVGTLANCNEKTWISARRSARFSQLSDEHYPCQSSFEPGFRSFGEFLTLWTGSRELLCHGA